jgi:hypothetical protein
VKKRIHVSRDVIFDEGEGWKWGELDGRSVESWTMTPPSPAAGEKLRKGKVELLSHQDRLLVLHSWASFATT